MQWPPDYTAEFLTRQQRIDKIKANPLVVPGAKAYYATNPKEFIADWGVTYDPRNASHDLPTTMPFCLFPRQGDFIDFLMDCLYGRESGLIEKSRDMGATWLCCAFSVWAWLYLPGSAVGWGSRKEQLVDKLGDPDSIFEKIRIFVDALPWFLLPIGWNPKEHSAYMRLVNPENGSTIMGEAGDNIGRGGRKLLYFKDESAHYQHPEMIEAALGDNTEVQIDISSVNGTANIFARRRQSGQVWEPGASILKGVTRVFIFDWREHPLKTQEWYDQRRVKAEREGLLHIFAQEVDRDYAAAVEGVLIPAVWVKAAIDVHIKYPGRDWDGGLIYSALDVADEGGDLNALATRKGIMLLDLDKWAQGDTGQTANKALLKCKLKSANELHYDCIGVGAGVKSETNRLRRDGLVRPSLKIVAWNAAAAVLDPEKHSVPNDPASPKNKDLFKNLKAQAYWNLRARFEKTFKFVTQGTDYLTDEMICLPSAMPHHHELVAELSQPTYASDGSGKIIVNKKPDGTRSPNLADSVNMCYTPWKPSLKRAGGW
jgi:hypothetical protein